MELQVEELLEKIKADGVEVAKREAERIVAEANEKARGIVAAAESQAREIEKSAEERLKAREKASDVALQYAARDTMLALRKKVQVFLEEAIKADTRQVLDAASLGRYLPELLLAMAKDNEGDISIFVSPKTLSAIDAGLAGRLAAELGRGVEFKPFDGLDAGFRVSFKDDTVQYDFSAAAVAEILSRRVDAHLAECLKTAASALVSK
jgi:V/A-type H+-transporting ATPase subunit E